MHTSSTYTRAYFEARERTLVVRSDDRQRRRQQQTRTNGVNLPHSAQNQCRPRAREQCTPETDVSQSEFANKLKVGLFEHTLLHCSSKHCKQKDRKSMYSVVDGRQLSSPTGVGIHSFIRGAPHRPRCNDQGGCMLPVE